MSSNDYTEVTNESWISRLGNSFKKVLVGIVLFLVSFGVLFWNEGRSVRRYEDISQGRDSITIVKDISKIDTSMNEKLVHLSGIAETDDILIDADFGVESKALKLSRTVEMYQWKEIKNTKEEKKTGGGTKKVTTYSYDEVWSSSHIDSSTFKKSSEYINPESMQYSRKEISAENVTFGAFKLSSEVVEKLENYETLNLSELTDAAVSKGGKLNGEVIYLGTDPISPQIGDMKVSYKIIKPQEISIIGKQTENTFKPEKMNNGTLLLVQTGIVTADQMFAEAESNNALMTWVVRLLGFTMMFGGLASIFMPISIVMDVLPLLGNIAEIGVKLVSFLLSVALSLFTIAIAWILYRPLLAILLLALVAASIAALVVMKKRKTVVMAA